MKPIKLKIQENCYKKWKSATLKVIQNPSKMPSEIFFSEASSMQKMGEKEYEIL